MIARAWHGRVPADRADEYYRYLEETGLPDYRATAGYRGLLVQRYFEADIAHFLLTTLWDDMDSIRLFAGEDPDVARYYPRDDDYLLEREPYVTHTEVLCHETSPLRAS